MKCELVKHGTLVESKIKNKYLKSSPNYNNFMNFLNSSSLCMIEVKLSGNNDIGMAIFKYLHNLVQKGRIYIEDKYESIHGDEIWAFCVPLNTKRRMLLADIDSSIIRYSSYYELVYAESRSRSKEYKRGSNFENECLSVVNKALPNFLVYSNINIESLEYSRSSNVGEIDIMIIKEDSPSLIIECKSWRINNHNNTHKAKKQALKIINALNINPSQFLLVYKYKKIDISSIGSQSIHISELNSYLENWKNT